MKCIVILLTITKLRFYTFNCVLTILISAFFKVVLCSKTLMYFTNFSLEEQHTESKYFLWYMEVKTYTASLWFWPAHFNVEGEVLLLSQKQEVFLDAEY